VKNEHSGDFDENLGFDSMFVVFLIAFNCMITDEQGQIFCCGFPRGKTQGKIFCCGAARWASSSSPRRVA